MVSTNTRIRNIVTSRAAATACASSYATGLQAFRQGDCSGVRMPIVFMSDAQLPGIGQHVQQSQSLGQPAILHYVSALRLTNRAIARLKCSMGMSLPVFRGGPSCDEYPFASSSEGGLYAITAKVPTRSNLAQGGVLSIFYRVCGVIDNAFPLNEFLVLPVAASPSAFECRF
jgi:hypothetical protein